VSYRVCGGTSQNGKRKDPQNRDKTEGYGRIPQKAATKRINPWRKTKMLISNLTSRLAAVFGQKQALQIIKDTGFDCADLSLYGDAGMKIISSPDRVEWAKDLKKHADSIGMFYNQAHAPLCFPKRGKRKFQNRDRSDNGRHI
jgi:hypothetical protein